MNIPAPFEKAETYMYTTKSMLIDPGSFPGEAWYIAEGTVRQYDIQSSGEEITLNIYKPGSVLSLTWILGGAENRYFFEAYTNVTVYRIPAAKYRKFLQETPMEAYKILERLSRGLDGMFMRISVNSQNNAKIRVMNEIKIEAARFGSVDENGLPQVFIATKDIANRTGLARETVSRTLTKLKDKKLILKNKDSITIIA